MRALSIRRVGTSEIRALDGLRAVAALSVLFYHSYQSHSPRKALLGTDVTVAWYFSQTGVHLFFVLSGFLLFLPYARAMLDGRPLPSAREFYRRRALRILPAYWACLAVLALVQAGTRPLSELVPDVAAHIPLLHDDFPQFSRSIQGPFWTLAIEAQFYVILPLLAAGMAVFVGQTRSLGRLVTGVFVIMGAAFVAREADALIQGFALPRADGAARLLLTFLLRVTLGSQGKFIAVFATGMLCAALYVAVSERGQWRPGVSAAIGTALCASAVTLAALLAPVAFLRHIEVPSYNVLVEPANLLVICGPWLIGLAYGALTLGILWSGHLLLAAFELAPLRGVGIMSYSLYLWHLPIVHGMLPLAASLPIWWRVLTAFAVAYASYALVERPFLKLRVSHSARLLRPAEPARNVRQSTPLVRGTPLLRRSGGR